MTWMKKAARVGYLAKGVTYVLIALLALQAAVGSGSAESTPGALQSLEGPPYGEMLLLAIALGLASYALWKFFIALTDPADDGWGKRLTALVVSFTNAGFAAEAFRLSVSWGGASHQGDQAQHWSGMVMSNKPGVIAVGIAGAFFIGYGISQLIRAFRKRKVEEQLRRMHFARDTKRWVLKACKFGIAARGVVFMLIGWFLILAAWQADPSKAKDFGHSLDELRTQPMGRSMLTVVAIGLFLYAVYQFLRARYERFET